MNGSATPRFPIGFLVCVGFGLAAAAYALALAQAEPRFAALGWVALAAAVGLLALGSTRRISLALVGILAITLPVYVTKGFFVYSRAPDQYVEHAGNFAVQISLPAVAAAAILILRSVSAPSQRILTGFRVEPLTASGAALCFAAGVLSLINASDARLVEFDLLRLVMLYLLTFVIGNLDRRAMRVYLGALAITVFLQGLLAVSQFMVGGTVGLGFLGEMSTQPDTIDFVDIMRPSGTLGNANTLGGFFSLTLPLLLGLAMTSERGSLRLFFMAAFSVGLAGMIASLSRGSWSTLPLNLAVVVLVVFGRRIFSLKAAAVGAVGILALMIAAVAIGPMIVHRVVADDNGSAQSRIPMLMATWSLIKQFPIFGIGLNNFADAFVRHDLTGFVQAHLAGLDNTVIVHNMYALVWAETGLVGLLAFLWYGGSAFLVARAIVRGNESAWERAVAAGTAMGIFAQFAQGAWDIGFRVPVGAPGSLVAAQIGLLAALRLQRRRRTLALDAHGTSANPRAADCGRTRPPGNPTAVARRFVGAALLAFLLPSIANAATLTVGSSGIYPSLTAVPWARLQPGDEILVQPGFVQDGSTTISAHGRLGAPIRIAPAPGTPVPVIHGSLVLSNASHVVLEGLIVENAEHSGVAIIQASHHITVQKMVIRKTSMGVWIAMGAGGSNRIADNETSANSTYGIGADRIINKVGEETVIEGNRVFDNGQHGIGIVGSRFVVEHNTVYDNGRAQYGTSGIHLYAGGFGGVPRLEGIGHHNVIRYNTVSRQHDDKTVDGNGIEADLWANDNEISYNVVYDNDGAGIVIFGGARNHIFNNTVVGNYRDSGGTHPAWGEISVASGDPQRGDTLAAGNVVKNNVVVSWGKSHALFVDRSASLNGTQIGGNLLYALGTGKLFSWAGELGNDIQRWNELAKAAPADASADPLFADIEHRPDGLRLRPDSPAARLGAPLGLPRDNAGIPLTPSRAPSAGAFEVVP